MNISITNFKKGPFGKVLAFFDVVLDDTFVIRGFALKEKNDGTSLYYQAPSKLRLDKDKNPVKNAAGYDVYDSYFDMHGAMNGEKYEPTEQGWDGRKTIIELATIEFKSAAAPSGRGTKAPAKAKATATAATASKTEDAGEDAEDDDLPF